MLEERGWARVCQWGSKWMVQGEGWDAEGRGKRFWKEIAGWGMGCKGE